LRSRFKLADAWSEAGCFNDALQVLSAAEQGNPGNKELETRLRVARSVVGEERFFDTLDRAEDQARLKRATFRCNSLSDLDACHEALQLRPDDAGLLTAQGDAFMHASEPGDAASAYRRAATLTPDQVDLNAKIAAADAAAQTQTRGSTVPAVTTSPPMRVARASASHRVARARLARESTQTPRFSNLEPESHSH
jgi:tetratricopeptide (TPR) repeat protein